MPGVGKGHPAGSPPARPALATFWARACKPLRGLGEGLWPSHVSLAGVTWAGSASRARPACHACCILDTVSVPPGAFFPFHSLPFPLPSSSEWPAGSGMSGTS